MESSAKLLRSVSDPKDAGHIGKLIPRPNSIANDMTNKITLPAHQLRQTNGTVPATKHCHSPSSVSMSSSTPSGEGSSSQSEYFSYDAPEEGTESPKISPKFEEWKPALEVGTDYEIIKGLRVGETFDKQVPVFEGLLSKKRRRRGTGFQKRFCRLEEGYLLYGKNRAEMEKGNWLGRLDIAMSVVVLNAKKRGIEIDATEAVHHFRAYTDAQFMKWAEMLRDHRLYRQARMASLLGEVDAEGTIKDSTLLSQPSAAGIRLGLDVSKAQLDAIFTKLDRAAALVEQWEMAASEPVQEKDLQNAFDGAQKKTTIRRFFTRKRKSDKKDETLSNHNSKGSSIARTPTTENTLTVPAGPSGSSASLPSHSSEVPPAIPPSPNPSNAGHLSDISHGSQSSHGRLHNEPSSNTLSRMDVDTLILARELISTFRVIGNDFRQLYNRFNGAASDDGTLKGTVIQTRIVHTLSSDSAGTMGSGDTFVTAISHFSNAKTQLMSDTSSDRGESHDEGCSSDSEVDDTDEPGLFTARDFQRQSGRRTMLPSPRPPADGSLLKMVGGFIGKDLTRLALPVKINEPLSMLQRLCEEMEYCELLDRAADCDDPVERMTLVATFAISGFASSYYRASTKPFNPLLGETYECIREDKGFRYVAEQVSHHPPISACHAESMNDKYCYWQDFRPKTRFWGRSIEITNHGEVHVTINKNEHYRWNKPSSRVALSALMSQKGNLEIYGTIRITCSNDLYATLTFGKSSSEGTPTHVEGSVHGADKAPLTAIFGSWNECVYWNDPGRIGSSRSSGTRVLWRAGGMPADHDRYYGFSRFAIELNEVSDDMTKYLPITDSRFRPDQRLLECGNLLSAELEKKRVEQAQRERQSKYTKDHYPYEPRWFRRVEQAHENDMPDIYEFTYRYWTLRESPGFHRVNPPVEALW